MTGEDALEALHPTILAAARGRLPEWAEADDDRRDHGERVGALLETWARARGEAPADVARWAAAGRLHDALRDADPGALRERVDPPLDALPGPMLHGPAAAARLREEGVEDQALLQAVAFHTLGHPGFDDLGLALYCGDFLEPGRRERARWREGLRERMPDELPQVVREIVEARIRHLLDAGRPIHPLTVELWNRLVRGPSWAGASEHVMRGGAP